MSMPGEQVASTFIDALKQLPLSLALVAMNLGLLGFIYYSHLTTARERHEDLVLLYENRREVGLLLAQCYPAPPNPSNKDCR